MLQEKVHAFWQKYEVLRPYPHPTAPIIVGVSGGPDSLALLHILHVLFPPAHLIVAHLHHGLRPTADRDAEFVRKTAESWGIPCYIEQISVVELARQEGLSLEEAGRMARFRYFTRLAREHAARVVVVAHQADDQAETVLMHILRGSGLTGLRGMLPLTHLPGASDLWLARPFLTISRAEIEAYCQQHHLQPIHDPTNQNVAFFRN
ncbi:MAG: tRNA lysidine(34) synthetase TilS, partial [Chloroflexi bacterium]